jgi:hypothetical protein
MPQHRRHYVLKISPSNTLYEYLGEHSYFIVLRQAHRYEMVGPNGPPGVQSTSYATGHNDDLLSLKTREEHERYAQGMRTYGVLH